MIDIVGDCVKKVSIDVPVPPMVELLVESLQLRIDSVIVQCNFTVWFSLEHLEEPIAISKPVS